MTRALDNANDACPFVDDGHAECGSHLTLGHLRDALETCQGGYRGCSNYWRLAAADPKRLATPIPLTRHGRPLQPTGT